MTKQIAAIIAALGLELAPITTANAFDVSELDGEYEDVFDGTDRQLSNDGGSTDETYNCRNEDIMSTTVIGSGKLVTCDELVTVV